MHLACFFLQLRKAKNITVFNWCKNLILYFNSEQPYMAICCTRKVVYRGRYIVCYSKWINLCIALCWFIPKSMLYFSTLRVKIMTILLYNWWYKSSFVMTREREHHQFCSQNASELLSPFAIHKMTIYLSWDSLAWSSGLWVA